MNYSFACPAPCNREIKVNANDHFDAVEKIIMTGAMSCRNIHNQCSCKHARLDMPPIPEEKLRHLYQEIVINARPKGEDERYATPHSA